MGIRKLKNRNKKTFNIPFNDQKQQSTLFPIKNEEWYITTPKFERLRKKLLKKQKESEKK